MHVRECYGISLQNLSISHITFLNTLLDSLQAKQLNDSKSKKYFNNKKLLSFCTKTMVLLQEVLQKQCQHSSFPKLGLAAPSGADFR